MVGGKYCTPTPAAGDCPGVAYRRVSVVDYVGDAIRDCRDGVKAAGVSSCGPFQSYVRPVAAGVASPELDCLVSKRAVTSIITSVLVVVLVNVA